jgi:uncharacterized protein (DUF58 family)
MQLNDVPRLARVGGLELAARRVLDGLGGGRHRAPALGAASEFHDHRAYQPGDDLRHLDWRVAARTDHLRIRRYREDRELPLVLLLDTSASMAWGAPDKLATAALLAAVLGLLACDQGDRVRLVRGGEAPTASLGGPVGARTLCTLLDQARGAGAADPAELLASTGARLERRSLLVLLSDFLQPPTRLATVAASLVARGHEVVALQVLDRQEVDLPAAWAATTLVDPEGRHPLLAVDAAAAKAGYDAAMRAHREGLARALAGARAELVTCLTDESPALILGTWLRRRAGR